MATSTITGTPTTGDARAALATLAAALANRQATPRDTGIITDCLSDFIKLINLDTRYLQRFRKLPSRSNTPDPSRLFDLIRNGDYTAAATEAKRIRALMKPIIESARAELKRA